MYGRIRQISRDFRKRDSEIGSDLFPANSGIQTLLTYSFVVSQAVSVCSSGVSQRLPDPSSVPFRSGMDIEARSRPLPSGSSRFKYSTNTAQSSKSTAAKLTLRYLATSNGISNIDFGRLPLFH